MHFLPSFCHLCSITVCHHVVLHRCNLTISLLYRDWNTWVEAEKPVLLCFWDTNQYLWRTAFLHIKAVENWGLCFLDNHLRPRFLHLCRDLQGVISLHSPCYCCGDNLKQVRTDSEQYRLAYTLLFSRKKKIFRCHSAFLSWNGGLSTQKSPVMQI